MSKDRPIELDVPDGVSEADQSIEVLSAWVADGSLLISLNADAFDDRIVDWGRLLAEIGHHIAKAAELDGHMGSDEALQALRDGFERTLAQSRLAMAGGFRGTRH